MANHTNHPGTHGWQWKENIPFSQTVTVGDQVFISGQQTLDHAGAVCDPGDIAAQTRNVFENMKTALAQLDMELSDLVRLNTYYVFDGEDADSAQYWEDMTRVRLQYFPDPGPAATAVRIKGMPYEGQLIQIEGVALRGESRRNRQRIMPTGSWDWSIPVPLSQGWKIGNRIFVGGQISADDQGRSVHVGNLDAQTRNIYKFIGRVLSDAGSSFKDIVHIKVCFKHHSKDPVTGKAFVDRIMEITKEYFDGSAPVLTAFAVDLLYPGLDLEIDAMAIVDPDRTILAPADLGGRYQPSVFSDGVNVGGEIYIAGQTALGRDGSVLSKDDVSSQAKVVFERLQTVLAATGAGLDDVVKLNLFIVGKDHEIESVFHKVCRVWAETCPDGCPAMTTVRVHELPRPGLLIQADCIALKQASANPYNHSLTNGEYMISNPVPWPNGAKIACAITFDIDTDSILHLEHRERAPTMLSTMSWLKYDEVAVPRLVELYARYEIKQTFFYPAWCMERYPHLVDVILKGGHEIAAHGYLHENPNKLSPEDELYWFERQIAVIEKMTGKRPRGWRAPLYNFSKHSIDYMIDQGFVYDASLMGDDVPYILKTKTGSVIELPSQWAMDDWPHYTHAPDMHYMMPIKSPDEAMNVFMSEFEAMYRNNGLWVTVWHPFVSGRLARCERIGQMIEEMQNRGDVWFATMEEIATHVQCCIDDGSWTPRVDNLPYYDGPIPELNDANLA